MVNFSEIVRFNVCFIKEYAAISIMTGFAIYIMAGFAIYNVNLLMSNQYPRYPHYGCRFRQSLY